MWIVATWWGCGQPPEEGPGPEPADPDKPALVCPGDPACPHSDGALRAGAARRSIVPSCFERWEDSNADATYDPLGELFYDCGCDALCPGDPGYTSPDEGEGDGAFQAVWVAGFQNSRPANGVRGAELGLRGEGDGLWASVLVLEQGETRVAIAALDAFGVMMDDTLAIRQAAEQAGLGLDYLVVHSSHSHHAPDTLGIYGPDLSISGYDPDYLAEIHVQVVDALAEATAGLRPVTAEVGAVDAGDYHPDGVGNLIVDTRDPVIVDPLVGTLRFVAEDGQTVATAVHFSDHPEELADEVALLTSNFAHALRQTVEEGVGGVALYLNGTVGGMMTSLGAQAQAPDGTIWPSHSFEKSDTIGEILGSMALDAVAQAQLVEEPLLSARRAELFLPVVNNGFQAMFLMGTLAHRNTYHWDPAQTLGPSNRPEVLSEVGLVSLGPWQLLCLPGEPFPELAIGGYDGAYTPPNQVLLDPANPNPPDLAAAPAGPYLLEVLGAPQGWVLGLASDQIGYLVPEPHFEVGDVPYLLEAEGDHYEETNSLGRETATRVVGAAEKMLRWKY
jgi:hypothetical protein